MKDGAPAPAATHAFGAVVQLVADLYRCAGPLDDAARLEQAMRDAAREAGAKVVGHARCDYVPHGLTMVTFLAESHLLVSTWPEHGFAVCEIMLCNPSMNPKRALDALVELLRPARVAVKRVVHDMRLEEGDGKEVARIARRG